MQNHGGDLLEHSLWAEHQTQMWIESEHPIAKHAIPRLAIAGALVHDIGKAGDCERVLSKGRWYFDVYSEAKYNGRGDRVHPEFSADYISGKRKFFTTCQCKSAAAHCRARRTIDPQLLLEELGVGDLRAEMVVVVQLHWEFGVINVGDAADVPQRCIEYVDKFRKACAVNGVRPSLELLCTCILVSCADIAAGTSKRMRAGSCSLTGLDLPTVDRYTSRDPWVAFGMDKNAEGYKRVVMRAYVHSL